MKKPRFTREELNCLEAGHEVKNKWDNDVEKYIMAYGTQEWADKMGIAKKKAEAEKPVLLHMRSIPC
jgi:hypothetical protein